MDLQKAEVLAYELMKKHGLTFKGWRFQYDRSKRRAGVCMYGRKVIGLSAPITKVRDEHEVRNTILHEIAHALVGHGHGHDHVWRRKAIEIGCDGKRCYDGSELVGKIHFKYIGTCPNGHEIGRHRLTRSARNGSCPKCSPRFDERYMFEWRQVA